MSNLLAAKAIGHIWTIETFSDEKQSKFWGIDKGLRSFEGHRERYQRAKGLGYPIVETNYVVATDSYREMMEKIEVLGDDGVAVVPNIIRNYNAGMLLDVVHPDVWDMGFEYVLEGFEASVKTYRHPTIKGFAGRKTVDYLNANGWDLSFEDLPIRHTRRAEPPTRRCLWVIFVIFPRSGCRYVVESVLMQAVKPAARVTRLY